MIAFLLILLGLFLAPIVAASPFYFYYEHKDKKEREAVLIVQKLRGYK